MQKDAGIELSKLSAIELDREIKVAEHYAEDSGLELVTALKEVQRLRVICQDIIETINTDLDFMGTSRIVDGIVKVERLAQGYYLP